MQRWTLVAMLAAWVCGCSSDPPKQTFPVITEHDVRLITIARAALTSERFSLLDAIYEVRRDGGGWVVQVDKAPGYTGVGDPSVVVDGTIFVKMTADEQVSENLNHLRWIKSTTRPASSTQASQDDWHRYDDPRFSADELIAVREATDAVINPNRPRPDFDQTFRYSVSKDKGGWGVTVWHIYDFKDGKPRFQPGGNTTVILDANFKVTAKLPGE